MIKHESAFPNVVTLRLNRDSGGKSNTSGEIPDTPKVILITPNKKLFINAKKLKLWH